MWNLDTGQSVTTAQRTCWEMCCPAHRLWPRSSWLEVEWPCGPRSEALQAAGPSAARCVEVWLLLWLTPAQLPACPGEELGRCLGLLSCLWGARLLLRPCVRGYRAKAGAGGWAVKPLHWGLPAQPLHQPPVSLTQVFLMS